MLERKAAIAMFASCLYALAFTCDAVFADAQIENDVPSIRQNLYYRKPILLEPRIEKQVIAKPITLSGAVEYSETNYPTNLRWQAEVRAAKENITVQILNEYLPNALYQWQEIMASHNKLTQTLFASPVFPAIAGPGFDSVSMTPTFFSGQGFSLDWIPIDFGLHRARIKLAKARYEQTRRQYVSTKFDTQIAAANAFLDAVEATEEVRAAEQNAGTFEQFSKVVHAQVDSYLRPGADASLADAQLSNAQNLLYQAQLSLDLALANLANAMGLGGIDIAIDPQGISTTSEHETLSKRETVYDNVPILAAAKASIITEIAERRVLDRSWYPDLHFLGGVSTRGAGLNVAGLRSSQNASGTMPVVPNYQLVFLANWNFGDWFRLHAEKKAQMQAILQQQEEYDHVLQNLKTEDIKSHARVKTALAVAANMPAQVDAARMAEMQAQARYKTGLGSVTQVAKSEQVLAQSRLEEARARIGVWRALLAVASVRGDIGEFLAEAKKAQGEI